MAWFAAAAPYIAGAATVLTTAQQLQAGKAQQRALLQQAREREEDAKAAQAESQREAIVERKKARFAMSRARAVAASSGAGASDPTVANILTDIETQGEVNALNALYSGNTLARGLNAGAASARREARATREAAYTSSAATALSGGVSWWEKYGT